MSIQRLCVFCGSRPGVKPAFVEQGRALGRTIAGRGLTLVYGGAGLGVMGAVAEGALAAGGKAIGVLPTALRDREPAHTGLTELHVVDSMHDRKAMMESLSDGFIALPGGFGTFEELFEMITWAQLGLHHKPVGLLNVEGYFDPLRALIDRAVADGFVPADHLRLFTVSDSPEALVDALLAWTPPQLGPKWLDRKQT